MNKDKSEETEWESNLFIKNESDWICILILMSILGFGWGNSENPNINELEKKVARLEGQMSMSGGKNHE